MSLEDPFFVVKDDVFKALNKTRGLYLRWRELGEAGSVAAAAAVIVSAADTEWTTTELRNSLRSIEWDLEDLEDTISIVEKNPTKFKIDRTELASRRHFIDATRDEVKSMKEKMSLNRTRDRDITARQPLLDPATTNTIASSPSANDNLSAHIIQPNAGGSTGTAAAAASSLIGHHNNSGLASSLAGTMAAAAHRHSGTKYSKLENAVDSPGHYALDSPSHRFVGDQVALQHRMLLGQDEQLDVISDSIGTLKTVSRQIGLELDEQAVMLDDFGNEMESTESKLDTTMKKVAKVLHMNNDSRQWTAIIVLTIMLLLLIVLFIVL